jgi:hypothetical protein
VPADDGEIALDVIETRHARQKSPLFKSDPFE